MGSAGTKEERIKNIKKNWNCGETITVKRKSYKHENFQFSLSFLGEMSSIWQISVAAGKSTFIIIVFILAIIIISWIVQIRWVFQIALITSPPIGLAGQSQSTSLLQTFFWGKKQIHFLDGKRGRAMFHWKQLFLKTFLYLYWDWMKREWLQNTFW